MPTEIRIASYPFTEYGSIKGKLISLAADSKATNPNIPAEHFSAVVQLDSNTLVNKGTELPIKPGMCLTPSNRPTILSLKSDIAGLDPSLISEVTDIPGLIGSSFPLLTRVLLSS